MNYDNFVWIKIIILQQKKSFNNIPYKKLLNCKQHSKVREDYILIKFVFQLGSTISL